MKALPWEEPARISIDDSYNHEQYQSDEPAWISIEELSCESTGLPIRSVTTCRFSTSIAGMGLPEFLSTLVVEDKDAAAKTSPSPKGFDCAESITSSVDLSGSPSKSIDAMPEVSRKKGTTRFVFCASAQQVQEFDLVPKLLGHGGKHLKDIAIPHAAKIRLRGWGSGFKELNGPAGKQEAKIPLQLCVSCRDSETLEVVKDKLIPLLDRNAKSFARFCRTRDIQAPPNFYIEIPEGSKRIDN